MKAWNYRHPNLTLAGWVFVWIVYGLSTVSYAAEGDWLWTVIGFIAVLYADSRCRYWYQRTGEKGET